MKKYPGSVKRKGDRKTDQMMQQIIEEGEASEEEDSAEEDNEDDFQQYSKEVGESATAEARIAAMRNQEVTEESLRRARGDKDEHEEDKNQIISS